MIQSVPLSNFVVESNGFAQFSKPGGSRCGSSVSTVCSSVSRKAYIPKLEPFSRNKFDRAVREPPLIQKSENEIADYCSTLEGDDSYSCWKAYFELKELEKDTPKEEVERLIIESGGVKSLIGCVHGVSAIHKANKECTKHTSPENKVESSCPIPDGLPKTLEELEEEDKGRMPDSPFTRLLRARGTPPAWYSPAPEHETD